MAVKELTFDVEARQQLLAGVEKLARAVKSTLGPRGRNAILDKSWGGPTVTKDGVSVAEEIELRNKAQNMGARLVKEAASKSSDDAGDGTTTATVLAEAFFREGLRHVVQNTAGDFIFIEPGVPHEVFNVSDTDPVVAVVARSDASEWANIVPYTKP